MTEWNGFRGSAKRLDDIDLPRIGAQIGVGEDELHAFMDVEARGSGFDRVGRPRLLFEPHVFWRNLPKEKRAPAQAAGLAWPKWRAGTYGPEAAQYQKLERAMEIDEEAALKACSWGLGQILGENHRMAGYDSVEEFVRAMMEDEENHLEAIVNFLVAAGIDDDLKAHRWEAVARAYNGPAYRTHNYHGRMKQAYEKWRRIKDTPWSPADDDSEAAAPQTRSEPEARSRAPLKLSRGQLKTIQKMLWHKGYTEVGHIDGRMGPKTRAAVKVFESLNGLPADGIIDRDFVEALKAAGPRPVPKERAEITAAELAKRGSKTVTTGQLGTAIGAGGAVVTGIGAAADAVKEQVDTVASTVDRARESLSPAAWVWSAIPGWMVWLLVALAFAGLAYLFWRVIVLRVQQERTGRTTTNPVPIAPLPECDPEDDELVGQTP